MDWLGFLEVMVIEEKAAQEEYQLAVDLAQDPGARALFEGKRDLPWDKKPGKPLTASPGVIPVGKSQDEWPASPSPPRPYIQASRPMSSVLRL